MVVSFRAVGGAVGRWMCACGGWTFGIAGG